MKGNSLVKTVKFDKPSYIGDALNTCRIFNELEVDEMAILDIRASFENRKPDFSLLKEIANECFMPLSYGGGINDISIAEKIFSIGYEKIILNSIAFEHPDLITKIAKKFGSQSVIVAIDVKKKLLGGYECFSKSATIKQKIDPVTFAKKVEELGAGEILLTSIDREGTWNGFDISLTQKVSDSINIPIIAHGGGGTLTDIEMALKAGHASAVGLGSMIVYQKKGMGVLVNFPDEKKLENLINSNL